MYTYTNVSVPQHTHTLHYITNLTAAGLIQYSNLILGLPILQPYQIMISYPPQTHNINSMILLLHIVSVTIYSLAGLAVSIY